MSGPLELLTELHEYAESAAAARLEQMHGHLTTHPKISGYDGTARWVSFCPSCYSRADLGSADVSDRLAARALLAETAAALAAAQEREAELRAAAQELLTLKDGPRDAAYHELKPFAWKRLRAALGGAQ